MAMLRLLFLVTLLHTLHHLCLDIPLPWTHLNPSSFKNKKADIPPAPPHVPYTITADTIARGVERAQSRGHLVPASFLSNANALSNQTSGLNLPQATTLPALSSNHSAVPARRIEQEQDYENEDEDELAEDKDMVQHVIDM
ncbi:hypothetical protein ARMGADRAFT_1025201 [Armillaria gallica]|uniref:Uncharacterized protein n=1 Tax=Armillaria gallica TaxID=47427 RepID=A0A2H3E584_ARMGA|nr:hypothetical protein ARMGADRAFT_1025201 [Armillaria gallica]